MYQHTILGKVYRFDSLRVLLAKASPFRTGDALAGLSADTTRNVLPRRSPWLMCL
jgi:ethanolamine ammonia-lyase large subunit